MEGRWNSSKALRRVCKKVVEPLPMGYVELAQEKTQLGGLSHISLPTTLLDLKPGPGAEELMLNP